MKVKSKMEKVKKEEFLPRRHEEHEERDTVDFVGWALAHQEAVIRPHDSVGANLRVRP